MKRPIEPTTHTARDRCCHRRTGAAQAAAMWKPASHMPHAETPLMAPHSSKMVPLRIADLRVQKNVYRWIELGNYRSYVMSPCLVVP